jgi:hypothetical protein
MKFYIDPVLSSQCNFHTQRPPTFSVFCCGLSCPLVQQKVNTSVMYQRHEHAPEHLPQ